MAKIDQNVLSNLQFELKWQSAEAAHTEHYYAQNVNTWRDCLPDALLQKLQGKTAGDVISLDFDPGTLVTAYESRKTFDIKRGQFNDRFRSEQHTEPRMGRFYPKGLLRGIAGVFPQNLYPFRCVGVQNRYLSVDFNHPLAQARLHLDIRVQKIRSKPIERGGRCYEWTEMVTNGPGMQARWNNSPTDFFSDQPFNRQDAAPDSSFYRRPRFVQHIDDTALNVVKELYRHVLKDGMRVLDLMSSWQSHIPEQVRLQKLTGLGLNRQELEANSRLDDRIIHDLNEDPMLPFKTGDYDAVLCTVSIEYLIQPQKIFEELGRILRPDGILMVTFSNRWFPPKVVRVWEQLHEFERMGLVLEYFQRSGMFKDLETYSMKGLPRPWNDKYFAEIGDSDPVFAVFGRKA